MVYFRKNLICVKMCVRSEVPYSKAAGRATVKYVRDHVKRVTLKYRKEYYEEHIQPAVDRAGVPAATFFKEAIEEKIQRESEKGEDKAD